MQHKLNHSRRKFFKKVAGFGVGAGTAFVLGGSALLTTGYSLKLLSERTKTEPVKEENHEIKDEDKPEPPTIIDTTIRNIPFKLHGMSHSRKFAESYYSNLENLIKNASLVVSEVNPDDLNSVTIYPTAKAYASTITELCKKHNKSMIYLDPLSPFAGGGETVIGG